MICDCAYENLPLILDDTNSKTWLCPRCGVRITVERVDEGWRLLRDGEFVCSGLVDVTGYLGMGSERELYAIFGLAPPAKRSAANQAGRSRRGRASSGTGKPPGRAS